MSVVIWPVEKQITLVIYAFFEKHRWPFISDNATNVEAKGRIAGTLRSVLGCMGPLAAFFPLQSDLLCLSGR